MPVRAIFPLVLLTAINSAGCGAANSSNDAASPEVKERRERAEPTLRESGGGSESGGGAVRESGGGQDHSGHH
jgi:hypothetical protein